MFGFSLPKIILLVFIIFVVWQIFRIIEKRNKFKNNLSDNHDKENESYESLIECKSCGNFYSKDENKVCPICEAEN
tara:strand:- start:279 stop:506 length:228 start_codon:yes stop_codon:yes gene_type:complete